KKTLLLSQQGFIGQTGFSATGYDFLSHPSASPAFSNFVVLAKFPKKRSKSSPFLGSLTPFQILSAN
ncbi:MAG: hypothetical protein MJ179_00275, partial [Treponema sp.]|nr:hypothetical protein [Treponema sp.]